jgi:hypothetical protein
MNHHDQEDVPEEQSFDSSLHSESLQSSTQERSSAPTVKIDPSIQTGDYPMQIGDHPVQVSAPIAARIDPPQKADHPVQASLPEQEACRSKLRRFKQLAGTPPEMRLRYRVHPTRGDKRMSLTIPIDMFEDLEKMALYQEQSIQEEILYRLQFSLIHNDETLFRHWLRRVLSGKLPNSSGPADM